MMKDKVCVLDIDDLMETIMEKAYCLSYAMHSGSIKMYRTIKENYWWSGMKRDVAEYVFKCLMCQ